MSVQVEQLSKTIERHAVLTDVSFEWQPGKIVGLVGRNGVGKTTLFRTMMGHYLADAGRLVIDGQDVTHAPLQRQRIFYVDTQHNFFRQQALGQLVTTYALAYTHFDQARMLDLLAEEHLSPTARYQSLSKGQRALFQILLGLASGTPYMILDEPFDGLDILVRERIVARIVDEVADRQMGLLISSHNLDELDGLCDQVILLKDHQLMADYD